jgi:hypothetical protein
MYVMYRTFKMRTNYICTLSVKGLFDVTQMIYLSMLSLFFLISVFFRSFLSSAVHLKCRRKCHSTFPYLADLPEILL